MHLQDIDEQDAVYQWLARLCYNYAFLCACFSLMLKLPAIDQSKPSPKVSLDTLHHICDPNEDKHCRKLMHRLTRLWSIHGTYICFTLLLQNGWEFCSQRCPLRVLRCRNCHSRIPIWAYACWYYIQGENEVSAAHLSLSLFSLVLLESSLTLLSVVPQSTPCELHKDFRSDPPAIPSPSKSKWPTQLLHEEGNLGLDWFPHEPNGNIWTYWSQSE